MAGLKAPPAPAKRNRKPVVIFLDDPLKLGSLPEADRFHLFGEILGQRLKEGLDLLVAWCWNRCQKNADSLFDLEAGGRKESIDEPAIWAHPDPAALLRKNIKFWSLQEDPLLLLAINESADVIGFRYAHALPSENGQRIIYDQNGGVMPTARRNGVSRALLREQHRIAKNRGYDKIRTGVAVALKPMIILNLQEGFEITELIWDEKFRTKILNFEKKL